MSRLHPYRWLIVGTAAAVLVPVSGLDQEAVALASRVAPLPWGRIGLGVLLFWCCAAFYFRSHWGETKGALRRAHEVSRRASARLAGIAADGERSAWVLRDNLLELTDSDPPPDLARLYLEGALAHTNKIGDVMARCRAVGEDLAPGPPRNEH